MAIVRLSVVMSSLQEPRRGYFNGFQTIMFTILCQAFGLMRSLAYNEDVHLDIVPADVAINAIIAVAQKTSSMPQTVTVYNVTDKLSPNAAKGFEIAEKIVGNNLMVSSVRVPRRFGAKTSKLSLWLRKNYDERLIFAIYSFILWLFGRRDKKTLYQMYRDMSEARVTLELVGERNLNVHTTNFQSLRKTMNNADAITFNMDFEVDEDTLLDVYDASMKHYRKYKLKEDIANDRRALYHHFQLQLIEIGLHVIALSIVALFAFVMYKTTC